MREKLEDFILWLAGYTVIILLIVSFIWVVLISYIKYKLMRGA